MKHNIAIVGATGAVGRKMLETLVLREFPFKKIILLASKKSDGKIINFNGCEYTVISLDNFNFQDADIAFFSAGSKVSEIYAPLAEKNNCFVIDNTSHLEWKKTYLIVPEINELGLNNLSRKIIANPNCSTIQMLVALAPIHKIGKVKELLFPPINLFLALDKAQYQN